jgi:hypothetical protein
MTENQEVSASVGAFVDAITQSYGQLALILDHMLRHASPGADPIPEVLARLLGGVLADFVDTYGADEVATAAQILGAATDKIAEEIYLVP